MKRKILIVLFFTLLIGCVSTPDRDDKSVKLYPTDESAWDSSFHAFRKKLDQALAQKDAVFIESILTTDVLSSFGGDGGVAEFKEHYKIAQSDSEFWEIMRECLRLGGTFQYYGDGQKYFVAPYVFSRFPKEFDAFFYAAIIKKAVPMRILPDDRAKIIHFLSYDVVKTAEEGRMELIEEKNGYVKNTTLAGEKGWVRREEIRSPIDYRVLFKLIDGQWKLSSLVNGD
ncbi:MAG: hypothetical protein C4527_24680 [Candidatus Omnitrophota bacterium]|nr:MAG: hypothetical protein C4527_24680 [Candidatus Omnitrophota bacterium]